jgi:methionyl-tRNA formyltransferase
MDEKMDHGPLIDQQTMKITLNDVRTDMEKKLTSLGTEMIKKCINSLTRQPVNPLTLKSQNHALATRAPYFKKEDGFVLFSTLQKALRNEPITLQELPHIIRNYIQKYKLQITNNKTQTKSNLQYSKIKQKVPLQFGSWDLSGNCNLKFGISAQIIYDFWRVSPPACIDLVK